MAKGKCTRRGCPFIFDDAEHIEDALEKLRAHWRTEHPTKAFFQGRVLESLETYNLTLDEAIANYAGQDWRAKLVDGRLDSRHVIRACTNVCTYPWQYAESLVREVQALSLEHGQEIADPYTNIDQPVDVVGPDGY